MNRLQLAAALAAAALLPSAAAAQTAAPTQAPAPTWAAVSAEAPAPNVSSPARAEAASPRLSLADALARARENSPRLAQAESLKDAAAAARDGARAQAKPGVDLSASYSRNSHVDEYGIALPGQPSRILYPDLPDNFRTRAQASVPLYTGGRIAGLERAAEGELAAATSDVRAARADLALETAAAYWRLVNARESERVLGEALASYERHLLDARHRQEAGLAARNEVLAVEVERDAAELARLDAVADRRVAEADLRRLLGLADGAAIEPSDELRLPEPPPADAAPLAAAALDARPEREALRKRAAAAEERAATESAGAKPQVSAVAGYDFANPNRKLFPLADSWRPAWDVGVNASWAVFDSGRTRARVAEARARADAARRALDDLERRIRLEVTQRALELETARAAVGVAERSLVSARENRRVAEERYRAGVIPSSELLDAETALLRAGLNRVSALARAEVASAALARATGR